MSFTAPDLDDRKFQEIVDELKLRIPRYCPEWTDHNVSDPGVTLIELFAYQMEQLLYRMNQLPQRHYLKFAHFLGIPIPTPKPAQAAVIFWLTKALKGAEPAVLIPKGTEVSTTQTETIAPIIFTTEEEANIVAPKLGALFRQSRANAPVSLALSTLEGKDAESNKGSTALFSESPQVDDAIYFEFDNDLSHHILQLKFKFLDKVGTNIRVADPPVMWEAYTDHHEWIPVTNLKDSTRGLNSSGEIRLQLPRLTKFPRRWNNVPTNMAVTDNVTRYSLRLRVTRREYDRSPELVQIEEIAALGRVVEAFHTEAVYWEYLGESDGTPGQRFPLSRAPVVLPLQPGETLWVGTLPELGGNEQSIRQSDLKRFIDQEQAWQYTTHFAYPDETSVAAGALPEDKTGQAVPTRFTIDITTNEVRLGPAIRVANGEVKQYGKVPERGTPIYFIRYRVAHLSADPVGVYRSPQLTGDMIVDVPAQAINVLKSSIPYVKAVENQQPAIGGQGVPSLEVMALEVQRYLRHHQSGWGEKAVTTDDYVRLVVSNFSEQVAKVECALAPDTPNTINIFVVAPLPIDTLTTATLTQDELNVSRGDIEQIERYLHDYRLLTVRIRVQNPAYVRVNVRVQLGGKEPHLLQPQIIRALNHYLHPNYGNTRGQGWSLASAVDGPQFHAWLVTQIPDIEIRQLQLDAEPLSQETERKAVPISPQWVARIDTLERNQLIIPGRYFIEFE